MAVLRNTLRDKGVIGLYSGCMALVTGVQFPSVSDLLSLLMQCIL